MIPEKPITAAFLPVYQNPYQHLLTSALEKLDLRILHYRSLPDRARLLGDRNQVDILHLHWLSGLYMHRFLTPIRLATFLYRLSLAQSLEYKLVWTAHNVLPHKLVLPPMHRFIRRFVMGRFDAVITHCQYGKDELLRQFHRDKPIFVVPHGNYRRVHPVTMSREEARRSLDIPMEKFVYLHIGNISRYKGITDFIHAFIDIAGPDDLALIAGRNRAPDIVRYLQELSHENDWIKVFPGFIPDDEMQCYLLASDVAVFAFENILSSGSIMLALSYGLPIIAPAMGCIPELFTETVGILYDPDNPIGIKTALGDVKRANLTEMSSAARSVAAEYDWEPIARATRDIYQSVL